MEVFEDSISAKQPKGEVHAAINSPHRAKGARIIEGNANRVQYRLGIDQGFDSYFTECECHHAKEYLGKSFGDHRVFHFFLIKRMEPFDRNDNL